MQVAFPLSRISEVRYIRSACAAMQLELPPRAITRWALRGARGPMRSHLLAVEAPAHIG